jgi:glycolate oxidase FAD binding subunit
VFGGQVMKNVAGYDVSRLLTGSMGCLAVLLELSLKVLPRPATVQSVALECSEDAAIDTMCRLGGRGLPLSAAAWADGVLHLRLSGARAAVAAASRVVGGETSDPGYWDAVRDQRTGSFLLSLPLWRVSVPAATPPLDLPGSRLIDWGGAQRWIATEAEAAVVRAAAEAAGGHATRYRGGDPQVPAFHPLPAPLLALHRRIKSALDPAGILNPGRLYASL